MYKTLITNIEALSILQSSTPSHKYKGTNTVAWGKYVLSDDFIFPEYLNNRLTRDEVFDICSKNDLDHTRLLITVLSWGGMRRDHGRRLLMQKDTVINLVENLKKGSFKTRKDAFSFFKAARDKNELPGLGIGYFTKLICFLAPNLKGYIMDQWVGKSVNILTQSNLVKIANNNWVSDENTSEDYENFCQVIDELASMLNCREFEAEEKLFSIGGKHKGEWRKYVIQNYSNKKISIAD